MTKTIRRSRRWDELSSTQQVLVMLAASIQISLAVSAWADLARRSPEQVNGSRAAWAAVIAVNVIGPITYFRRGRRKVGSIPSAHG